MVGLLIITHDQIGTAMIDAAQHILASTQPMLTSISVCGEQSPDDIFTQAQQQITTWNNQGCKEVLILSDLFGATPSNIAHRLTALPNAKAIAGLSLPMLLKVITYRHLPLVALIEKAQLGAAAGIILINTEHGED